LSPDDVDQTSVNSFNWKLELRRSVEVDFFIGWLSA